MTMVTNHAQIQMTVKENRDTQGAHLSLFFVHVVIVIDQYTYPQMCVILASKVCAIDDTIGLTRFLIEDDKKDISLNRLTIRPSQWPNIKDTFLNGAYKAFKPIIVIIE